MTGAWELSIEEAITVLRTEANLLTSAVEKDPVMPTAGGAPAATAVAKGSSTSMTEGAAGAAEGGRGAWVGVLVTFVLDICFVGAS